MGDATFDWGSIASSLLSAVKSEIEGRAKGWLAEHHEAEQFLITASEDLAKALLLFAVEEDPARKESYSRAILDLRDAIKEESLAIEVSVEGLAKSSLWEILGTAFNILIKVAPELLALV